MSHMTQLFFCFRDGNSLPPEGERLYCCSYDFVARNSSELSVLQGETLEVRQTVPPLTMHPKTSTLSSSWPVVLSSSGDRVVQALVEVSEQLRPDWICSLQHPGTSFCAEQPRGRRRSRPQRVKGTAAQILSVPPRMFAGICITAPLISPIQPQMYLVPL